MKFFFFVLSQLSLVTIVYAFAYRAGYRNAQSKAMSVVKRFADPVTSLLDQLNGSIEEASENEQAIGLKKRPSTPPEADKHRTSNIER